CHTSLSCGFLFFFFFQAEDGIRDRNVTGVQTCALPIFPGISGLSRCPASAGPPGFPVRPGCPAAVPGCPRRRPGGARPRFCGSRSEERRVGKECRSRGSPYAEKEKRRDEGRLP